MKRFQNTAQSRSPRSSWPSISSDRWPFAKRRRRLQAASICSAGSAGPRYRRAALLHELYHLAVLVLALRAVLADVLKQRRVRHRIDHRVARTGIDVSAPKEVRDDHDIVG